jgi:hypothetical protein
MLQVIPGPFKEILNDSMDYQKSIQNINMSKWYSRHNFGISKKFSHLTINNHISFEYQSGKLKSNLHIIDNNSSLDLPEAYKNDNISHKSSFINTTELMVTNNQWRYSLSLPLQYINLKQHIYTTSETRRFNHLFLSPHFTIARYLNKWKFIISASKKHNVSDLFTQHKGLILTSYNQLKQFIVPIDDQIISGAIFNISYKEITKGLNITVNTSYSQKHKNFIYTYNYDVNSHVSIQAVPYDNTAFSKNITFQFAKYFFRTKTNLKWNLTYFNNNQLAKINGKLSRIKSENFFFQPSIDFGITKHLSLYLYAQLDYLKLKQNINVNNSISFQHNYSSKLYIYPYKNHRLKLFFDYYLNNYNNASKQLFINFAYQYKIPKRKIDFNLEWRNITNKKQFISIQNLDNILLQSYYTLRPSQIIMGMRFSF